MKHDSTNHLIQSLNYEDRLSLKLERHFLSAGNILQLEETPCDHVYFIESGFASMIYQGRFEDEIETAMIGAEGCTAFEAMLGASVSLHRVVMQVPGVATRTSAFRFKQLIDCSVEARTLFRSYAQEICMQQSAALLAASRATLQQRLARWLILACGRGSENIAITHEILSQCLGARRSYISRTLQQLAKAGLIELQRGAITVLCRHELQRLCENYLGSDDARRLPLKSPASVRMPEISAIYDCP